MTEQQPETPIDETDTEPLPFDQPTFGGPATDVTPEPEPEPEPEVESAEAPVEEVDEPEASEPEVVEKEEPLLPVQRSGLTSVPHDDLNPGFRLDV